MVELQIKLIADRVVVKTLEEKQTISGLVLPDTAQEKPQKGEVIAVGPGKYDKNNKIVPMAVKVGDIVLFAKYAGTEIKHGNEKYLVLKEADLLAIIEQSKKE